MTALPAAEPAEVVVPTRLLDCGASPAEIRLYLELRRVYGAGAFQLQRGLLSDRLGCNPGVIWRWARKLVSLGMIAEVEGAFATYVFVEGARYGAPGAPPRAPSNADEDTPDGEGARYGAPGARPRAPAPPDHADDDGEGARGRAPSTADEEARARVRARQARVSARLPEPAHTKPQVSGPARSDPPTTKGGRGVNTTTNQGGCGGEQAVIAAFAALGDALGDRRDRWHREGLTPKLRDALDWALGAGGWTIGELAGHPRVIDGWPERIEHLPNLVAARILKLEPPARAKPAPPADPAAAAETRGRQLAQIGDIGRRVAGLLAECDLDPDRLAGLLRGAGLDASTVVEVVAADPTIDPLGVYTSTIAAAGGLVPA